MIFDEQSVSSARLGRARSACPAWTWPPLRAWWTSATAQPRLRWLAQVGEQRGDLGGGVLVDAMQAHEGALDDEPRPQSFALGGEAGTVVLGAWMPW